MPPTSKSAPVWHMESPDAVFTALDSSPTGLTTPEASRRLSQHGPNEIQTTHGVSAWTILFEQFQNIFVVILLLATVLSLFLGHGVEAVAIAVIVLFAVLLGFTQEFRAEKALLALQQMAAPLARVLRDGAEVDLPARDLVPGDVVVLHAGDKLPADLRVIEAVNLQAEEAALTGESEPVEKQVQALPDPALPLGDRKNMLFAGTATTYGRGRGVVVTTGMATEFGKIAQMLQTVRTSRTPLQENLDRVGVLLARAAIVVVAVIVAFGLFHGHPWLEMLLFGVALAVAVVPEALPAVVTVSLAIGVQRMVRRNALIRRLPAVETLGSTSVICTDKTGTLTRNEMTVRQVYVGGELLEVSGSGYEPKGEFSKVSSNSSTGNEDVPMESLDALLRGAALASDAELQQDPQNGGWRVQGDPTEGALLVAAAKAGLHKPELERESPRIDEIPFSSETKRMTTLHRHGDSVIAYCKGAPEILLPLCTRWLNNGRESPLDEEARKAILTAARNMAGHALRVLGVASKTPAQREDAERDLTLLGLLGMIDPPRPEARAAIEKCEIAGIQVVMMTGDHPETAAAVARELGLNKKSGRVVTGGELERMSDADLERDIEQFEVYARVSPAHKLRVVTALQHNGHVVAMTGDGVNDAPALKKADIGIAMGITGTDVSKEAAAMTLIDDNFASIVAAVEEGRSIFGNIRKYLMYLLSANVGEILLIASATLLGLPMPLSTVQILYVNLATDGLPALALALDPPDSDLMQRPPRNPRSSIFMPAVVALMVVGGLWSAIINLGLFVWYLHSGRTHEEAMTLTFVSLVLIQFFKAYNFRSDRHSVLERPFANRWLNLAIAWELLLLAAIIYTPFLQVPFETFSMSLMDWVWAVLLAHTICPVLEFAKRLARGGWFGALD